MISTLESPLQEVAAVPFPVRTPPLRASDGELVLEDPFAYFLQVRLGLTHALAWSKALSRGSWVHKRLEYMECPTEEWRPALEGLLAGRCQELQEVGHEIAYPKEKIDRRVEAEKQDFACALAWFEALSTLPISNEYGTFYEYLMRPQWKLLGCELLAVYPHPDYPETPLVCQFDRLYWHEPSNALWILDAKTCAGSPRERLQTCPIEFGTRHYIHTLRWLLEGGIVHESFDLPPDVRVGGMMHLALQKPTIELCGEDRDFRWYEHTLKSGPRKGQVEMRKEYLSEEPRFENYVARCVRYLKGEGEYLDKQAERAADPPVNISFTSASCVFDEDADFAYHDSLRYLASYARREPHPRNFPMNASYLRRYGKLDDMAAFYLNPPSSWHELCLRKGYVQKFRDEHITPSSTASLG
jgi:hypothetical protein